MGQKRAKQPTPKTGSKLEDLFLTYLQMLAPDIPPPVLQHKFHPTRKYRADFAWPDQKVIVEVQGGQYVSGRHTRGSTYDDECRRNNDAVTEGWRMLYVTGTMIAADPLDIFAKIRLLLNLPPAAAEL